MYSSSIHNLYIQKNVYNHTLNCTAHTHDTIQHRDTTNIIYRAICERVFIFFNVFFFLVFKHDNNFYCTYKHFCFIFIFFQRSDNDDFTVYIYVRYVIYKSVWVFINKSIPYTNLCPKPTHVNAAHIKINRYCVRDCRG